MYKSKIDNKIKNIDSRVKAIEPKSKIMLKITFTSDTDYEYTTQLIKNDKVIKILDNENATDLKELCKKYDAELTDNFDELTTDQLRYLADDLENQTSDE